MAVDINAYFKTKLDQATIETCLAAQDWIFSKSYRQSTTTINGAIAYSIKPDSGFFMTIVNRNRLLEINGDNFQVQQYWSFRLDKEVDSSVSYSAIAKLINWATTHYKLSCCLSWDGETVDVLFERGEEYIINSYRDVWANIIRPLADPKAIIRFDRFEDL